MELKFYLLYLTIFLVIEALSILLHSSLFSYSLSLIQQIQSHYTLHNL